MTMPGQELWVRAAGKGLEDTLAEVDATVATSLGRVRAYWTQVLEGDPDDILGRDDLPGWLDRVSRHGGKRVRPVMCHWGYVCSGDRDDDGREAMVVVAAALELLHVFALIHDDVMDESDTRRGRPSAHRFAEHAHTRVGARGDAVRYGESLAILLGDLAHAVADALVADLGAELRRRWFELSVELIAGQREDLSGAAAGAGDRRRAQRIARIKSGAYTVTRPLQLGATAGRAEAETLAVLAEYGTTLGAVFAARDDLLGVWGDPALTGKPSGDDLRQRKPTLLWVDAEGSLDKPGRVLMDRVGTPDERPGDVEALQEAMVAAGVQERAERCITDGVDEAVTILDRANGRLHPDGVAGLMDMTHRIAWRTS